MLHGFDSPRRRDHKESLDQMTLAAGQDDAPLVVSAGGGTGASLATAAAKPTGAGGAGNRISAALDETDTDSDSDGDGDGDTDGLRVVAADDKQVRGSARV